MTRVVALLAAARMWVELFVADAKTMVAWANQWGERLVEARIDGSRSRWHRAAQEQAVLTVVTVGIIIGLGILVYDQVINALPTPSNNSLEDAQNNSTDTFASTMELAPVILIVIIASVVIGVVARFRT